ncbi:MFS transporter [Crossiella cryophila]|uniref:MFS family permease n=1 Tax=Crossiella cryophila TaxID=43355 RepID=A0A7W7CHZ1_9PSEU|nr:MFS transporter [Crossiella cryophila]MBB4679819.1 MFS family permease [Crossiella cryophila]
MLTPAFRRLWAAGAVSTIGDAMNGTTVVLWLYSQSTAPAPWLSALVLAGFLPRVLVVPLYGRLADRFGPRGLMIGADLLCAVLALLLAGALVLGSPVLAVLCVAALAAGATLAEPAQRALTPATVGPEQLTRANSLLTLTTQLGFTLGPAAAAIATSWLGPVPAILFDAATFLTSALVLAGLRLIRPAEAEAEEPVHGTIRSGLAAIRGSRVLLVATAAALALSLSAGVNNTIMVVFLDRDLGGSPADIAWLSGVNGIAQIVAGGVVVALAARLPVARGLAVSMAVMAAASVLMVSATDVPTAIGAVLVTSLANAPFSIAYTTLCQTAVPERLVGRVFAITGGIGSLLFMLGSLAGGALADSAAREAILLSASALVLAAVLAAPLWRVRQVSRTG